MRKILILLMLSVGAYAQTVHRVTNGMNLQTVIDDAASGDVVLVEGGNYGNINLTKSLKIFGTGYFLDGYVANNNLQASSITSIVGSITFGINSSLSEIQGLSASTIQVSSNQINIIKTKFSSITIGTNSVPANNILIKHSLFQNFEITPNSSNILFLNNIITGTGESNRVSIGVTSFFINNTFKYNALHKFYDASGHTGIFKNNIFAFVTQISDCWGIFPFIYNSQNTFRNNLFLNFQRCGCGGCASQENFSNTQFHSSNLVNQNQTTYFLQSGSLTPDAQYQLAPNSPAKGAGENGTDCGAFGGDDPYVLSGIPNIPTIYQLTVPGQVPANGTLNIQIKAKTNN